MAEAGNVVSGLERLLRILEDLQADEPDDAGAAINKLACDTDLTEAVRVAIALLRGQ